MGEPAISIVNDDVLVSRIEQAQSRLVLLAPGVSKKVADCLCRRWQELTSEQVTVILDLDPEIYRLGYGDLDALKALEQTARSLGTMLQRQPGIRIGLLIADETTIIYSPTPQLIEAGPTSPEAPNAVVLGFTPPQIADELGSGEDGIRRQTIGLEKAKLGDIKTVEDNLNKNPPLKFDIARTVRVFNAAFEFVELELKGCLLSRKTVQIPSDLMGLAKDPKTQRLLTSHFKLVGQEQSVSSDRVVKLKKWICDRYLVSLTRYGNVVLRNNKPAFEAAIKALRRYVARFQRQVVKELQKVMDANRKSLVVALMPAVIASPPRRWTRFLGDTPTAAQLAAALEGEIERAFGSASDLASQMEVSLLFKGVTYESLSDPQFIDVARKAIPMLKQLHEEYDAARGKDDDDNGLAGARCR